MRKLMTYVGLAAGLSAMLATSSLAAAWAILVNDAKPRHHPSDARG